MREGSSLAIGTYTPIRLLGKKSVVKTVREKRDTPRVGREREREATTITILVCIRTEVKHKEYSVCVSRR